MIKAVGSEKNLLELPFYSCISDIYESEEVQKLGNYTHHIHTTRLQHSLNVSYYNYIICKFLRLNAVAAARAGLLHDLFYYERKGKKSHFSSHPEIALENAKEFFDIDTLESDMIEKHMWPVRIKRIPKYKESYVIVFVDKYCAILEVVSPKYQKMKSRIKSKIISFTPDKERTP